jgi:hypothetical protein
LRAGCPERDCSLGALAQMTALHCSDVDETC